MVKARKVAIADEESKRDDTFDIASTLEAEHSDEPLIDESRYERTDEYGNVIDASNDDADVDYLSDTDEDFSRDNDGDAPRVPLSPAQIKRFRQSGARLKYQFGYLNWGNSDHRYDFILNKTVATGMKLIALPDLTIATRELFFNSKPLETHSRLWLDCLDTGGIPPRPNTFTDKKEWERFPGTDNVMDPWSVSYTLLLTDESGSVLLFQANKAETKQAVGALINTFDGRRPIVELAKSAANRPIFKVVGHAKQIDDFEFVRDVLIVDDEPYVKPKFEF